MSSPIMESAYLLASGLLALIVASSGNRVKQWKMKHNLKGALIHDEEIGSEETGRENPEGE